MQKKRNRIIVICGRKGCGKTTMMLNIARRLYYGNRGRMFVLSPHDDLRLPGLPVIRSVVPRQFELLRGRSALVIPSDDDLAGYLFRFVWFLQEKNPRPVWLLVDEIDLWLSAGRPDPDLMKIVKFGRNRNINLVAVFQRCANVHNDLLAQADDVISFQVRTPGDLDFLRKYAGIDPDRIKALREFEYIHSH